MKNHARDRSVAMGAKLLRLLLPLATLPMLVSATSISDGHAMVEDFYRRYNSSRPTDLVFLLDSSSSVSRKLWISMITFVKVGGL